MSALFANTFYWIALADFSDSAHQRALDLTTHHAASQIITTDEVLTGAGADTPNSLSAPARGIWRLEVSVIANDTQVTVATEVKGMEVK